MRAKLPEKASKFTSRLHVKSLYTQFTYVTCSSPVKTDKFTQLHSASTSRRIHAHCLQPHVNLPEHSRFLKGKFTCGTYANSPAIGMQNCLLLQAKIHAIWGKNTRNCRQKYLHLQEKIRAIAVKNTRNCKQYCYHTAGKFTCQLQLS